MLVWESEKRDACCEFPSQRSFTAKGPSCNSVKICSVFFKWKAISWLLSVMRARLAHHKGRGRRGNKEIIWNRTGRWMLLLSMWESDWDSNVGRSSSSRSPNNNGNVFREAWLCRIMTGSLGKQHFRALPPSLHPSLQPFPSFHSAVLPFLHLSVHFVLFSSAPRHVKLSVLFPSFHLAAGTRWTFKPVSQTGWMKPPPRVQQELCERLITVFKPVPGEFTVHHINGNVQVHEQRKKK